MDGKLLETFSSDRPAMWNIGRHRSGTYLMTIHHNGSQVSKPVLLMKK